MNSKTLINFNRHAQLKLANRTMSNLNRLLFSKCVVYSWLSQAWFPYYIELSAKINWVFLQDILLNQSTLWDLASVNPTATWCRGSSLKAARARLITSYGKLKEISLTKEHKEKLPLKNAKIFLCVPVRYGSRYVP